MAAIGATLAALAVVLEGAGDLPTPVTWLLLGVAVVPWWLEAARAPLPLWPRVATTALAVSLLLGTGASLLCVWFTALLAVNAALVAPANQAVIAGALLAMVPGAGASVDTGRSWLFASVATGLAFASGWAGRSVTDLVQKLRRTQSQVGEQATLWERQRIARDVHDVLAHSLTVTMLHMAAARLALPDDPAEADNALAEAEHLGRASLDDIRRIVVLLARPGDPEEGSGWDLAVELDRLVGCHARLGHDISRRLPPEIDALPPTVVEGLSRIAGEALTNASRHAPGSTIDVGVEVHAASVILTVRNGFPASGRSPAAAGSELGVTWMTERAELLGGALEAGPTREGWLVRCQVPLPTPAHRRPHAVR